METRKDLSSVYRTKGGIPYHIGIRFENSTEYGNSGRYIIEDIDVGFNQIKYVRSDTNSKYSITIKEFEDNIDTHWWKISNSLLPNPSTIKFDLNGTKIWIRTPDEAKWLIEVAKFNGFTPASPDAHVRYTYHSQAFFFYAGAFTDLGTTAPKPVEHFVEHGNREISIQEILDQQPLFKEGDTLKRKNASIWVKVTRVTNKGYHLSGTGEVEYGFNFIHTNYMKEDTREIIGYELLKDLPGVTAGNVQLFKGYSSLTFNSNMSFDKTQLLDTTWFKPVYKVNDIVVNISMNRKVRIYVKEQRVELTGHKPITFNQFRQLLDYVFPPTDFLGYTLNSDVVSVGCQSFTKDDITLVNKTIQTL